MQSYKDLLWHIINTGEDRKDRTGVGTRSVFGHQWRHNLSHGFPLLTTKKLHTRSIVYELLWFLRGETNIKYLQDNGVTIWDEWADANGDLGPVYGKQWRRWNGERDQIRELIHTLKSNPDSRRHIVTAWNPDDVPHTALPPCHCLWQCYVSNGKLSLSMYQRSCDAFLGLPFNIASYALLTHMLARVCGLEAGDLIISFGDLHLYQNHFQPAATLLGRAPRPLPTLWMSDAAVYGGLQDFEFDDLGFHNYDPHPFIKAPIAV